MNHPIHNGTAENCKDPRLPISSNNAPDTKDPIGVARLWTEAEMQIINVCFKMQNNGISFEFLKHI